MEYQQVIGQVQWWAEIGTVDGGGIGRMDSVDEREVFPTNEQAEKWLTEQGWIYDDRLLRRVKPGNPYGLTSIRRVTEFDRSKWISTPLTIPPRLAPHAIAEGKDDE